jgi:ZIP family zinc transporter
LGGAPFLFGRNPDPLRIWLFVLLPLGLALAAGAMLLVVTHEVIPESRRNGHDKLSSLGLLIGFCLMMVMDTTLG